jgi:hypothetical protein
MGLGRVIRPAQRRTVPCWGAPQVVSTSSMTLIPGAWSLAHGGVRLSAGVFERTDANLVDEEQVVAELAPMILLTVLSAERQQVARPGRSPQRRQPWIRR